MQTGAINKEKSVSISFRGVVLGVVTFEDGAVVQFSEKADDRCKTFVNKLITEGVPSVLHLHDDKRLTAVFRNTLPHEKKFQFELTKALTAGGYEIYKDMHELDQQIKQLVNCLPDGEKIKKDVLANLSSMSYLEKTYIKAKLEEKFDQFLPAS